MATFLAGLLPRIVRSVSNVLGRTKGAYSNIARGLVRSITPAPQKMSMEEKADKSKIATQLMKQRIDDRYERSKAANEMMKQKIADKYERSKIMSERANSGDRSKYARSKTASAMMKQKIADRYERSKIASARANKITGQHNQQLVSKIKKAKYLDRKARKL